MKKDFGGLPRAARDFLSYMEAIRNKSPNTVKEYYYDLRTFLNFIYPIKHETGFENSPPPIWGMEDREFREITLSDIYAFLTFLSREKKSSPKTRARKAAAIKSFFKYLHAKAKILEVNPAQELDSPRITKTLPRYLNKSESLQLLSAVDGVNRTRDLAILVLFLNCGLRVSELVGIDMNRIDWENSTLQVMGKGGKERVVFLNRACQYVIRHYLEVRPSDKVIDRQALFLSNRKQRISRKTVHTMVKSNLTRAGLDSTRYSSHKLRHTAATLMYLYGNTDIKTLQVILGHESISTTEIYTHIDKQQLREAADNNPLAGFLDRGHEA